MINKRKISKAFNLKADIDTEKSKLLEAFDKDSFGGTNLIWNFFLAYYFSSAIDRQDSSLQEKAARSISFLSGVIESIRIYANLPPDNFSRSMARDWETSVTEKIFVEKVDDEITATTTPEEKNEKEEFDSDLIQVLQSSAKGLKSLDF